MEVMIAVPVPGRGMMAVAVVVPLDEVSTGPGSMLASDPKDGVARKNNPGCDEESKEALQCEI